MKNPDLKIISYIGTFNEKVPNDCNQTWTLHLIIIII